MAPANTPSRPRNPRADQEVTIARRAVVRPRGRDAFRTHEPPGAARHPHRRRPILSRMTSDQIADNLAQVRSRIDAAARRAGRNPAEITLVAVSKTFDADHVRAAWEAGQRDFGENKVQEAERKIAATTTSPARVAPDRAPAVQQGPESGGAVCDDPLGRLDRSAEAPGWRRQRGGAEPEILLQADLAGKPPSTAPASRISPAGARGAREPGGKAGRADASPPWNENQEVTRPWFVQLRRLRDRLTRTGFPLNRSSTCPWG